MAQNFQINDTQQLTSEADISQQVPLTVDGDVPDKSIRLDVTKLGHWISDSSEEMLRYRRDVELDWQKIRHILNGNHYFDVDTTRGVVTPSIHDEDDDGEVEAYTNLMLNAYRRELGTRTSVPINHIAVPRNASSPNAAYVARRAEAGLRQWREESKFSMVFDRFNQLILRMGLAAFLPEPSWDQKSAIVHVLPGSEIFPLPVTATNLIEASGSVYRKFLSKSWLEENVDSGRLAADVLTEITEYSASSRVGSPFMSHAMGFGGRAKLKGAIGLFFYIEPGPEYPEGNHGLVIGRKVYSIHLNQETGEPSLPIGGAPIIVHDTQIDSEWYPQSYLMPLIGLNLEDNRQLSNDIAIAEVNRHGGWTMIPEGTISINDLQQSMGGYIPYSVNQLGFDQKNPFFNIRPPQIGPESSLVSSRIAREAEETTGHTEAKKGDAPGRVDSDSGIQRLLSQSDVPNYPFYGRTRAAVTECFNKVLDILAVTWPAEKWVSIVGPLDIPQEMVIRKGEMPTSQMIRIEVGALVPTSKQSTMQMLQLLRQGKDISSAQYRRAIVENGLEPKGISLKDPEVEFARSKITWMYGDGQKPNEWPFTDDFEMEPHAVCVAEFRLFMNTIAFKINTDPEVKAMMRKEVFRHQQKLAGDPNRLRSQFDTEEFDRDRFEDRVIADEDQPGGDNELLSELMNSISG